MIVICKNDDHTLREDGDIMTAVAEIGKDIYSPTNKLISIINFSIAMGSIGLHMPGIK